MFESAELLHAIDDATYRKRSTKLREHLLEAQYDLLNRKEASVVVLIDGMDGAGKGETANLFHEWMDPRHLKSTAFGAPTTDEAERPPMWRYWQALPPSGKIGILFDGWYTPLIRARATGAMSKGDLAAELERLRRFERMLVAEHTILVKLWFHLTKAAQKRRFQELEGSKLTSWRITRRDWRNHELYGKLKKAAEPILRDTSTGEAPWVVIDGSDPNYRSLTAASVLLRTLRVASGADRTPSVPSQAADIASQLVEAVDTRRILTDLKFEERLSKSKYETRLERAQGTLARLSRTPAMKRHSVVAAFEGMDAAGKGGAIRRVTQALDARIYDVIPIAAPTAEERAHPYLWRFWRHIPRQGRFVLYDRSWYGRVLVERVEQLASEGAWTRAYHEINDFEEQLVENGIVVVKIWLAITEDEQLRRFEARERLKFKQYKITPEDWRNRKKWDAYISAAGDMIDRTSTAAAPWTVIEANDKHLARVRVIETICQRMKEAM